MLSGFTRYDTSLNVLALVGGHPFDRNAFAAMFDSMAGISVTFVDHPAAQTFYRPETFLHYQALLLYDVPGIDLYQGVTKQSPEIYPLSPEHRRGLHSLLETGIGVVALHHAIAGWQDWDDYAHYLGGRFQYLSGQLDGRQITDSGYRRNVKYDIQTLSHPVSEGIEGSFSLIDELYLYEVFDEEVVPIARANHTFTDNNFYSAESALKKGLLDSNDNWHHPQGSNLLAWAKPAVKSPLVYIQPGDDARTFSNTNYRKLVENALHWVVSDDARCWASQQATEEE